MYSICLGIRQTCIHVSDHNPSLFDQIKLEVNPGNNFITNPPSLLFSPFSNEYKENCLHTHTHTKARVKYESVASAKRNFLGSSFVRKVKKSCSFKKSKTWGDDFIFSRKYYK